MKGNQKRIGDGVRQVEGGSRPGHISFNGRDPGKPRLTEKVVSARCTEEFQITCNMAEKYELQNSVNQVYARRSR